MGGLFTNAYVGLITYLTFPTLFIIGLLLIPIAWWIQKKRDKLTIRELADSQFSSTELTPGIAGSRLTGMIALLTGINILFMTGASFQTLHFMDSAEFCGTACHTVMNPEWTTYQASPHARVKCVECHVGEGIEALVNSKLNGARQMIMLILGSYKKPIHTPVKDLRPARETCEKCHWPEKFYGHRLHIYEHYREDEHSTRYYNTLSLKVDTGKEATRSGIHWHIAEENEVRYTSVNDERIKMMQVEARQPDGSYKRYQNRKVNQSETTDNSSDFRIMDCVDCHNRATHIYEDPQVAIDDRLSRDLCDLELPYLKREMLHAITINYRDLTVAREGIRKHLYGFYRHHYPHVIENRMTSLDSAVETAVAIYERNVHPYMDLYWGTYPSFIHHRRGTGCFRCHNENLVDSNGEIIAYDCTTCHSILAFESNEPFQFIQVPDPDSAEYPMHQLLHDEFLGKIGGMQNSILQRLREY